MGESKKVVRIDVDDVKQTLRLGFNIFCSTCKFLYKAQAENKPFCEKIECGGVLFGRSFPDYAGNIPRNKFDKICLMCGDSNLVCKVKAIGNDQEFALCFKHKGIFDNIVDDPSSTPPIKKPLILPLI